MAAIIRVKRRLDEDPAENLIIQYKRSRTDGSETDEPAKLCLSLVTTVKSKDEALSRPLQKTLRRQQLQTSYKSHDSKRLAQARAENTAARKANRYKIVNSRRTVGGDLNDVGGEAPAQTVEQSTESVAQAVGGSDRVSSSDWNAQTSSESSPASAGACSSDTEDPVIHDVEVDGDSAEDRLSEAASSGCGITLNGQPLVSTPTSLGAESSYVYDLYYASTGAQRYSFRDIENILSIEAFHDSLASEADRVQEFEEVYEDEDDSNDEDNWRNDYPDEDPDIDDDGSDVEYYGDFLEGEAPHLYRSTVEDDFLSEALGTRLHIYGSDAPSSSEDESNDEDAYEDDDNCHRASSYMDYKRQLKEDTNSEDSD